MQHSQYPLISRFCPTSSSSVNYQLPNPVCNKPAINFSKVYLSHRNLAFILLSLIHIAYLVTLVPLHPVIYIIISHSRVNQHPYLQCLLMWHILVFLLLWPLNFKSIFLLLSFLYLFERDFCILLCFFHCSPPSMLFYFPSFYIPLSNEPNNMVLDVYFSFSLFFFNNFSQMSRKTLMVPIIVCMKIKPVGPNQVSSYYPECYTNAVVAWGQQDTELYILVADLI